MASSKWSVRYFESAWPRRREDRPSFVDKFNVESRSKDGARSAAKEWLEARGRVVDAVSFSASTPNELLAYVRRLDPK